MKCFCESQPKDNQLWLHWPLSFFSLQGTLSHNHQETFGLKKSVLLSSPGKHMVHLGPHNKVTVRERKGVCWPGDLLVLCLRVGANDFVGSLSVNL